MSIRSFKRSLLATGAGFLVAVAAAMPARADVEEERGHTIQINQNFSINLALDAALAGFSTRNTGFGIGSTSIDANGQRKGSRHWLEGFVKPQLGLDYNLGDKVGTAYGRFSTLSVLTRGDGDAQNPSPTADRPERTRVEDAAIGWKSAFLFEGLGDNAVDLSVGQQSFSIGDGFLVFDGIADGNRRAGYVLGPRTAFEQTAIARINTQPIRADLFRLRTIVDQTLMREADQPDSELIGANLEWFESHHQDHGRFEYDERKWYVGVTALHFTKADSTGSKNFSFGDGGNGTHINANRDGLNVYSARVGGAFLPFLEDFSFFGEYAIQRNNKSLHEVNANAWYVEPQYTFSKLPWEPRLGYRYAHFSGDGNTADQKDKSWDPLFPETGPRGIGTWTHGEIYGRYSGLGNSNVNLHQIHLRAKPIDDVLSVGFLLYRFNYAEPSQTANVTSKGILDEVNVYAEWTTPVKGLSVMPVLGAAKPREGLKQSLGTADANNRTLLVGQVVVGFKF